MKHLRTVKGAQADIAAMLERHSRRYGFALTDHVRFQYESKLSEVMARFSEPDPIAFEILLARNPVLQDELIAEFTVGETYFFRDWSQFEALQETILPERYAAVGASHPIRIWSAACASGEDPYSLAMLADSMGLSQHVTIVGTDIARRSLAKARRGVYGAWSLRGERPDFARRYLQQEGDSLVLRESIRKGVTFDVLNLADAHWHSAHINNGAIDILLCRNVFIYFDSETVRDVACRLHECLAPGGWLLTAATDPPLWDHAPFETHFSDAGVLYRRAAENRTLFVARAGSLALPGPEALASKNENEDPPAWFSPSAFPTPRPPVSASPLRTAQDAFRDGDAQRAYQATLGHEVDEACACMQLRALSGFDEIKALQLAPELVQLHPFSPELRFLHALILMLAGQSARAVRVLEDTLFLDRSLAVVHLLHGTLLRQLGNEEAARRAFERAMARAEALPAESIAPFGEGDTHARIAAAARHALTQSSASFPSHRELEFKKVPS